MVNPIQVIRDYNLFKVFSQRPTSLNLEVFSFTATAGQLIFTLPSTPTSGGLFILSINAGTQDAVDFSVTDNILTLTEAVDLNDKVYGTYEK